MRRLALAGLCALVATLAPGAAPARAERALISANVVKTEVFPPGPLEDACGVALAGGNLYVSDYYHHRVDVFSSTTGEYLSQISAGTLPEGPCGLAAGPGGALYANVWHESVVRLLPSSLSFDEAESTGVAVDGATGKVYVDDRTHVAVYEPSGAPLQSIGAGTLGDAYGVAVSGAKVYVADAADEEVKVYEPSLSLVNPVATIGGFNSLTDATLAVDATDGHLLVLDNLQPGFAHPEAAIKEFDPSGASLGRAAKVVDGEPSGLALSGGNLYVTSGNDEGARVLEYGPYTSPSPSGIGAGADAADAGAAGAAAAPGSASVTAAGASAPPTAQHRPKAHASELVQRGHIRVALQAAFAPKALPRSGTAPIRVSVGAEIGSTDGGEVPQLRQMTIALNREGRFDPTGLPVCRLREIEPATTANALAACRGALVGEGRFEAKVHLGHQSPFPSAGKLYAFNARLHGRPAILAHVYGTEPVPTSYTLPFEVGKGKGTFGIVLRASLPQVTGDSGFITGLSLKLGRSFSYRGARHSYLSAGCPAPKGFPGALFPFARAKLAFAGGKSLSTTVTRSCKARRS